MRRMQLSHDTHRYAQPIEYPTVAERPKVISRIGALGFFGGAGGFPSVRLRAGGSEVRIAPTRLFTSSQECRIIPPGLAVICLTAE